MGSPSRAAPDGAHVGGPSNCIIFFRDKSGKSDLWKLKENDRPRRPGMTRRKPVPQWQKTDFYLSGKRLLEDQGMNELGGYP